MKLVAIIQARRGSTRLPDKVLADVAGKMLVHHVIERARLIDGVDQVAVATTTLAADDALVRVVKALDVAVVRGSAADVLGRYAHAAKALSADAVVRITADCPLLDPVVSAAVVERFRTLRAVAGAHYASNIYTVRTFPDGLDTEVFTREALERAAKEARSASDREHVTPWIQRKMLSAPPVTSVVDLSSVRWTVDTAEDLDRVRAIYAALIQRALDGHSTPETMYSMAETMAAQLAATEARTL